MAARARLVVLGATGTVGRNALDVVRRNPERFEVLALTANRDADALAALCREFAPAHAALCDPSAQARLATALAGSGVAVARDPDAAVRLAALPEADLVLSAIVGAAGLLPTLAAVRAGKRVLIANKEPLVMAGGLLMQEAARAGATLVPVDSEHNAVWQCLGPDYRCGTPAPVARLWLTASGGPFRDLELSQFAAITPAAAIRHPNWVMGPKISVDSATMMNKGLEQIEARWLFALPPERIRVVLHRQSLVHALVEFADGSTLAHLGPPDMRVPIASALGAPLRLDSGVAGLDPTRLAALEFGEVDPRRYPCLRLAHAAMAAGGSAPNVLNAANEVAVEAFLDGRAPFTAIAALIERALEAAAGAGLPAGGSLEDILATDTWARGCVQDQLAGTAARAHA